MGVRRRTSQRQQQRAGTGQSTAPLSETTPKAPRNNSQNEVPYLSPSAEEVHLSVESLYADDLKPFGRILRKRVAERATMGVGMVLGNDENLPDVDIKHLRNTCDASPLLRVEPEEGGDWSALILGKPEAFVNVYSPADVYSPDMWNMAAAYFQVLDGDDMYLPGGRYSCAQALQARNLPFLASRSLGQVCHIVQLAISQKKILGYLNGAVVPYARSQSMVKEQCAAFKAPCTLPTTVQGAAPAVPNQAAGVAGSSFAMATWDTARQCLREILDNAAKLSGPDTVGMVPLSNVKRLFRSRFHTELSETMLGHSKLSELLQDERFGDICSVQLQGHGYIVMQAEPQENQTICLADTLPVYGGDTPASEPRRVEFFPDNEQSERHPEFCTDEPLTLDMDEAGVFVEASPSPKGKMPRWPPAFSPSTTGYVGNLISAPVRTFIHAFPPPPTPDPNARRRSTSLPKDVGSDKGWEPQLPQPGLLRFVPQPAGQLPEGTESTIDSLRAPSSPAPSGELSQSCRSDLSPGPALDDPVKAKLSQSCRSDLSPGPALDDPVKVLLRECNLSASEPVKMGNSSGDLLDFGNTEDGEPRRRLQFCPDEPLALEEAGVFLESAPCTMTPTGAYSHPSIPRWPAGSPWSPWDTKFKGGRVGSMPLSKVQNTFIHSPLPPPTPLRVGACRRARSVPKDAGSDKDAWEATCQALGCSQMLRFHQDPLFGAGDCGPTPSVYADYMGPDMPCSLASSPAFVPPSPALTASPTYSSTRQLRLHRPVMLAASAGLQSPVSNRSAPMSPTPERRPNVISLADLLQG